MDRSQRQAARVFAITTPLLYVVIMIAYRHFYGPFQVWRDDATTARNFAAHEHLLHFYIASAAVYGVGTIIAMAALYVMFRTIGRGVALFAVFARLLYAVMWFIFLIDLFGALRIMKGGTYLRAFEPDRQQALAGLQIASGWDAYYIGLTFYALGAVLFSYLFFKSRYVPRVLAVFGILSSLFEGLCGFAYLADRNFGAIVSVNWYEMPVFLFEVVICIWLLVRGLRPQDANKMV